MADIGTLEGWPVWLDANQRPTQDRDAVLTSPTEYWLALGPSGKLIVAATWGTCLALLRDDINYCNEAERVYKRWQLKSVKRLFYKDGWAAYRLTYEDGSHVWVVTAPDGSVVRDDFHDDPSAVSLAADRASEPKATNIAPGGQRK